MRGALFNILGDEVAESSVLDLFSGTGSLGLEALSRGAKHCVFVEMGFGPLQVLRQNLDSLGFGEQATVLPRNVFDAVTHLAELGRKYDLVFAAPPYAMLESRSTAEELFRVLGCISAAFGYPRMSVNLQHSPGSHVPEDTRVLERFDHRRYGLAELSRFRLKRPETDGD
jgi:16S rRNA (guanine(966)-N(2))-methyltransferase RsmD